VIESAGGLGAPLTARLAEEGITVVDVPAEFAARVRLLSMGTATKTMPLMRCRWASATPGQLPATPHAAAGDQLRRLETDAM
jgi:hypothetical protein